MDIGTLRGLLTLFLLLMFVGIWLWAWSGKRKESFQQAAHLPLDETATPVRRAKHSEAAHHE